MVTHTLNVRNEWGKVRQIEPVLQQVDATTTVRDTRRTTAFTTG
ncbi:MAG TPA: hypothetical protein VD767_00230 [Thermomicrobiales bacterium]|nr:hypothetical protein [Thermomicrobiales bacterium]